MNTLKKLIAPMGLLSLLFALPAMAQIENGVKFDAPSAFYVGNTQMPAGSYTITQPDDNEDLLLVEDGDGSHAAFVGFIEGQSAAPHAKSDVVFTKQGDVDFLSAVWIEGQRYEMRILPDKTEQNAAKTANAEKPAPSIDTAGQQ